MNFAGVGGSIFHKICCLKLDMRSVAEGLVISKLALTEGYFLFLLQRKLYRSKSAAFVSAVAKRLVFRLTARTPPVVTRFEFEDGRFFIKNNRVAHQVLLFDRIKTQQVAGALSWTSFQPGFYYLNFILNRVIMGSMH